MSDAQVRDAAEEAELHFTYAARLFEAGGFNGDGLDAYRSRMGFMHAVQAGHTSLEASLLRILEILEEQKPAGEHWHADLIRRAARAIAGENARPPILPPELASYADETRRFRNLATRGYGSFDVEKSVPAVEAARALSQSLLRAIAEFQNSVDPPGA